MEGLFAGRPARSNLVESELAGEPTHLEVQEELSGAALSSSNRPADATPAEETNSFTRTSTKRTPVLWAVGGGKGGVGKSLISANFAVTLGRKGHKVIAVDLDLGGANLHTCLGMEPPVSGLGDWASGRNSDFDSLLVPADQGVQLLSGSQDPLAIADIMEKRRDELLAHLRSLDADDVILDLGAGTHNLTVDFFSAADRGILSVLPEPTSVENAYRFIRAVLFRRLLQLDITDGIHEIVDAASDPKNALGIKTPGDLLAVVDRLEPSAGLHLREALHKMDLSIVINQVRSPIDVDVGRAICSVCRRYFGLDVKYAGYLDYDNSVWKSVRSRKAVIKEYPHSVLANRIERMTRTLLGEERGLFP
ncbi:MAG: P-loop NTPase [Bdellovibrionales bacterium]|nr:P-loop NTPase [Bdellovibrionales bacterium]